MSDPTESRMRELVMRVMHMAPPPPAMPEEGATGLIPPPRRSRRPLFILVGTALAVLVLVGVPLLLAGDGGETAAETSTTVAGTSTVAPTSTATTTTVPTTTTSSTAVPGTEVVVYLSAFPENADNPTMVPVPATASADDPVAAVQALLARSFEPPEGTSTSIPEGITGALGCCGPQGVLTLDMSPNFVEGGAGMLGELTILNQIAFTATRYPSVDAVQFTVGGDPVTVFGSEGLEIDGPIDRTTFADISLAFIIVDNPVSDAEVTAPFQVSGTANVFEANVLYRVETTDGTVLASGFTTATCSIGCWGDFSADVGLDSAFAGEADVVVYWESPEDGGLRDVVRRPIVIAAG